MGYAHAVDDGDEAQIEHIYSEDAELERHGVMDDPGIKQGWPAIRAALAAATGFKPNEGRHLITTTMCLSATTDEVVFRSHFVAFKANDDRMSLYWGDYLDTVRNSSAGWRLSRKLTTSDHHWSFLKPS
jgi:hypothetical protein